MKEDLKKVAELADKHRESIHGEQHTKNVLIEPVLKALGFDITNPFDIITEYSADFGVKKGEKVDYALQKDKEVIMLVEAKDWKVKLESKQIGQLFRYFSVSKARIGVLTNGLQYMFFTDILQENTMDMKPFFVFDILNYTSDDIAILRKFHKKAFSLIELKTLAKGLLVNTMVKEFLVEQVKEPSMDFMKLVLKDMDMRGHDLLDIKLLVSKSVREALLEKKSVPVEISKPTENLLSNRDNNFTGKLSGLVALSSFTSTNASGTKPLELIFVDATYQVKTWAEVLVSTLQYVLLATKSKKFVLSLGTSSKQKAWISKSIEGMQTPKPLGASGLYVDTCASAQLHITRIRGICRMMEIEEKDVFIRLK